MLYKIMHLAKNMPIKSHTCVVASVMAPVHQSHNALGIESLLPGSTRQIVLQFSVTHAFACQIMGAHARSARAGLQTASSAKSLLFFNPQHSLSIHSIHSTIHSNIHMIGCYSLNMHSKADHSPGQPCLQPAASAEPLEFEPHIGQNVGLDLGAPAKPMVFLPPPPAVRICARRWTRIQVPQCGSPLSA